MPGQPSKLWMRVVISDKKTAHRLARAWSSLDVEAVGHLLGYPACCCRFYVEAMLRDDAPDIRWAVVSHSVPSDVQRTTLDIDGRPELNIFWRYLGIKAIPHIPCSFSCQPSHSLARQYIKTGNDAGHEDSIAWLTSLLRWPLEWSALHGIAEMKTPVLKICADTVPTAGKLTANWRGDSYPEEGAKGVSFPFRQTVSSPARRFTEGLNILYPHNKHS